VAGDLPANLQQAQDLVGAADGAGADLVVFPELHVSGYLDERLALRADDNRLAALSASAHAGVVLGFPEQDGGARFNSAALYVSGQLRHVHRKLILPSYGPYDERARFAAGQTFSAFDTPAGRAAILLCEDVVQTALATLAVGGAKVLVVSAQLGVVEVQAARRGHRRNAMDQGSALAITSSSSAATLSRGPGGARRG
jgi:predicted amidohydrolase